MLASARVLLLIAVLVAGCSEASEATTPPKASVEVLSETPTMVEPKVTLVAPTAVGPIIRRVSAEDLGASWRPDCPVGPEQLRLVEIEYHGFDGVRRHGELVVRQDLVDDVREIFAGLLALEFPIERMRTLEHYSAAEDELSMRDNNTSAFNCRRIPGSAAWSEHAYGRAIDINPLLNPSISASGLLEPATAGDYVDRTRTDKGMLHDGDPVVQLFADHGWAWGGYWRDPKDYQHFERSSP